MFNSLLLMIHIIVFKVELPLTRYHHNSDVLSFQVSTYILPPIYPYNTSSFLNTEAPQLRVYDDYHLAVSKQQQFHCTGLQPQYLDYFQIYKMLPFKITLYI